MACLKFSKYNKNYKYIAVSSFFAFLTNYIFGYIYDDKMHLFKLFDNANQKNLSFHIIYHHIFRFLGLFIISFICYKYEQRSSEFSETLVQRNSLDSVTNDSSAIILIYKDAKQELNTKLDISPITIFIVIIIMVIETILEEIYYKSNLRGLDLWMFELLIVSLFNLHFLNFKIFSHHYLAIFINIIFGLIYKILSAIIFMMNSSTGPIPDIYKIYKNNGWIIPIGIIFYLLILIPRAYAITKIKVFMDLKYISPFKLLIFYGFIGTLICSIVEAISTFTKCPNIENFEINICKINNDKNETYFENFSIYYKHQ